MGRKYVIYSTKERLAKVNPENTAIWRKYINGKRTLSDSTKVSYENDINQLFVFLLLNYDNKCLFDFDIEEMSDILDDFIAMCTSVFCNNEKRIARRLSSISSLYIYYKKKRKIKENPVELLERPNAASSKNIIKQTYLTLEQVEEIRRGLEKINNTQLTLYWELSLFTAGRVNAISNIMISQIDFDKKRIIGVIEKEGYEVVFPIDERCKELILKWLDERKAKGIDNPYLFIAFYNQQWKKVDKKTIQLNWIKKIGAIVGIPELHAHDTRHTSSNLRYLAGCPLETVSKILNHKNTDTTRRHYLEENIDKLQDEMDKYSI